MEIKLHILYEELVAIVRQLSPTQKAKLQKELGNETQPIAKSRLTDISVVILKQAAF